MDHRPLRRARLLAASGLLVVTLGTIASSQTGRALGPVIALTPYEVTSDNFIGILENPVLSGRGEAAAAYEAEGYANAWMLLDSPGPDPAPDGLGITVSGNSCMSLSVVQSFNVPGFANPGALQSVDAVFVVNDRCRGIVNKEIYRTPDYYNNGNILALSFTGRFAAIAVPTGSESPNTILRIDTENLAQAQIPNPAGYSDWDGTVGVDISDDGSVIVATAVAFSQPPNVSLPPVANKNVFAWNVPTGAVTAVSGNGPSAGFPSVSGDGRFVSFAASKPLVGGESGPGPWVYVADRADGSIQRISPPNASAFDTSLTRDGSQVAYTLATTGCGYDHNYLEGFGQEGCPGRRIDVAFGPAPGFEGGFSTETISVDANNNVGGIHMQPALSGNGRWVAWISNSGNALLGSSDEALIGQHAFMRRRDPDLAVDPINFGTIGAGTTSTVATTVRNTGRTSVSLDSITVSPTNRFTVQGGGTCVGGSLLPPGATCTVNVRFSAPNTTSNATGTLTVAELGYDQISAPGRLTGSSSLTPPPVTTTTTVAPGTTVTTVVGQVPPPGRQTTTTTSTTTTIPTQASLSADPNPVDFGQVAVGIGSPIKTVTVTNIGTGPGQLLTELGGANPTDFFVSRNGCDAVTIGPGESCSLDIIMIPGAGGIRTGSLILTVGGASGDVDLIGDGHFAPQLIASPSAIRTNGLTTIIGRGFPPNEPFTVKVGDRGLVFSATADATGAFRVPFSAFGKLELGNYIMSVDPVENVFDQVRGQLVVALPTFEPQGPGGPAFGEAILVTRGG